MKISYNWLSKYIDMPYEQLELVEKLTMLGIEVESYKKLNDFSDTIVAAEILERTKHPNADRLSVCKVNDGEKVLQIVCGAPNCDMGKIVPLAKVGTIFKDDSGKELIIKEAYLRGVESSGMLCSAKELGLSSESSGLMELDSSLMPGVKLNEVFKTDTVYDLEITSNRPDWNSYLSIAREISAVSGRKVIYPLIPSLSGSQNGGFSLEINDYNGCPKYSARIIRNIKVADSPKWLKDAISSIGLKPINNVVDITNFVLFETGQPLHAFDLDKISGNSISIRMAKKGETIKALDGKNYNLKDEHLVVADSKAPLAIAGVIGGEESSITEATTNILLECAFFNPLYVKRASRDTGIFTDSSYRFERGVAFEGILNASDRAASLIIELCGGELASEVITLSKDELLPKPHTVRCSFDRIRSLAGIEASNDNMLDILKALELTVDFDGGDFFLVYGNSYRLDIEREADVAEEILRIYGLDKIVQKDIEVRVNASFKRDTYQYIEKVRDTLVSLGLNECLNYTLIDKNILLKDSLYEENNIFEVINPISSESSAMRPSLFWGLIKSVFRNISYNNHDLKVFETGKIYSSGNASGEETYSAFIFLTGRRHPEMYSEERKLVYEFSDIKGLLESFLDSLNVRNYAVKRAPHKFFASESSVSFEVNGNPVACCGEIKEIFTDGSRLRNPLYGAEIELSSIVNILKSAQCIKFMPIPVYPSTSRDIALCCNADMESSLIEECIRSVKCDFMGKIELFDLYQDKSLGDGRKSMAYTISYMHPQRTLTDAEVNKFHEKVRVQLSEKLSVELRQGSENFYGLRKDVLLLIIKPAHYFSPETENVFNEEKLDKRWMFVILAWRL